MPAATDALSPESPPEPPAPNQDEAGTNGGEDAAARTALDRLRSGIKSEQSRVIGSLYTRLNERAERIAAKMLGAKAQRVDLQPESVVMSVMARELPRLAVVCRDDQHLEARLVTAIRNRFIDRLRAKKHFNQGPQDERTRAEPADSDDGPGSVVIAFEQSGHEREALARLVRTLTAACKDEDERTMVVQFLVKNQSWSAVAAQLGKNETAAKVAFSRLRQRLLTRVTEPLRLSLSGPEWGVVQAICIERRTVGEAAAELGTTRERVMEVFQSRILPALRAEYGVAGIESLVRLIGKLKAEGAGGADPAPRG